MLRENSFNGPLARCLKRISPNSLKLLTLHDRRSCVNPLKTSMWRSFFFSSLQSLRTAQLISSGVMCWFTPGIQVVLLIDFKSLHLIKLIRQKELLRVWGQDIMITFQLIPFQWMCSFLNWSIWFKVPPRWYPRGIQKLVSTYDLPDSGPGGGSELKILKVPRSA